MSEVNEAGRVEVERPPPAAPAPPYAAARVEVTRLPDGRGRRERDEVAVEEPLEIRIDGRPVAVTMRTPGHDEELALGFCLSERLARSFYTTSSCGVCGKGALEAVAVEAPRVDSQIRVFLTLVSTLPERLRDAQAT